MNNQSGHIYIIREREFLKTGEKIYKIGKSTCVKRRMMAYPKGSRIELIIHLHGNIHEHERLILKTLQNNVKQRTDIGSEYFECKLKKIKKLLYETFIHS